MPVYVTFNGKYTDEQYLWLIKAIGAISALKGFSGLIVADVAMLLALSRMKYNKAICVSTGGTIFNSNTVDFHYALNATRVVLDRQLTVKEITEIVKRKSTPMEYEIFVFHSGCMFIDGYCTLFHCQDSGTHVALNNNTKIVPRHYVESSHYNGCQQIHDALNNDSLMVNNINNNAISIKPMQYKKNQYPYGCNLCQLYDLKDCGNITLKVVGRGSKRLDTVKMISHAISLI